MASTESRCVFKMGGGTRVDCECISERSRRHPLLNGTERCDRDTVSSATFPFHINTMSDSPAAQQDTSPPPQEQSSQSTESSPNDNVPLNSSPASSESESPSPPDNTATSPSDNTNESSNPPAAEKQDSSAASSNIHLNDPLHSVCFYDTSDTKCVVGTDTGYYSFLTSPTFKLQNYCVLRVPIEHVVILEQRGFPKHNMGATVAYAQKSRLVLFNEKEQTKKQVVQFSKPIIGLDVINGFFLVQIEKELRVLDYQSLKKLATFPTYEDSPTPCWGAHGTGDEATIVYPGPKEGHVNLVKIKKQSQDEVNVDAPIDINSHKSAVRCLVMNEQGTLFATSSMRGTVIRVYDTKTGKLFKEVRRGTKPVTMYSLAFSHDSKYMCCYSSSGTVHIFGLGTEEQKDNTYSSMYMLSYMGINYLSSEWSMAEYAVLGGDGRCAFAPNSSNQVNVATSSGRYVSMKFDLEKKDQEPEIEEKDLFAEVKPSVIDARKKDAMRFKEKIPGKLPLYLDKAEGSKLPILKKRRYLVPQDIYFADFVGAIHEKLGLAPETKLVMYVGDDTKAQAENVKFDEVYKTKQSVDGFLYVRYGGRDE